MMKNVSKQYYVNMLNHFIGNSEEGINKCWYLMSKKNRVGLYLLSTEDKINLYRFFMLIMLYKDTKKVNKTALKVLPNESRYNIRERKDILYLVDREEAENELIASFFNSPAFKKELNDFISNIGDGNFDITDEDKELLEKLIQRFQDFSLDPDRLIS